MDLKDFVDKREPNHHSLTYLHIIKKKIRECEKYKIDYDAYIDNRELIRIIDVLDCCLHHKDSKYIERTD